MFKKKPIPVFSMLFLLSFALSLGGCGRNTPTPMVLDTVENFIRAVRATGVEVKVDDEGGPALLGLVPQNIRISGERLLIYNSPQVFDAPRVLDDIKLDPAPHFLWVSEHLIVQYTGTDGGTVLVIESLLGAPVIGPAVPGDEPYPPAIPAALRQIATELGAQPAQVEVLGYEMVDWRDTCLDIKESDDICGEAITPGWRIQLRLGEREIEVHTDSLGLNVRWRDR